MMNDPSEPHYEATQKAVKAVTTRGRASQLTARLSDDLDHLESALEALYERITSVTGPGSLDKPEPPGPEASPEQSDLSEWLEKKARFVNDLTIRVQRMTDRVEL